MAAKLPFGVSDTLVDETYDKNRLESRLASVFGAYGYNEVVPATLEYYDSFLPALGEHGMKNAFKFADSDGSLLVLRPDPTVQILRLASRMEGDVKRVQYHLNTFEYLTDTNSSRTREFSQAGVELMGRTGLAGDVEVIEMSVNALRACGLKSFVLEIGHVGFFEGLLSECQLNEDKAFALKKLIASKDSLGTELFLQENSIEDKFIEKFSRLPLLFGGEEVLDVALEVCDNSACKSAIDELKRILEAATALGLSENVSIDLGLLSLHDYYSGIVLRAGANGKTILDGGRYDRLSERYGVPQAVGFSIGTARLADVINQKEALPLPDLAYVCDDYELEKKHIYPIRKKISAIKVFGGIDELKKTKAKKLAVVDGNGIKYIGGEK